MFMHVKVQHVIGREELITILFHAVSHTKLNTDFF